MIKYILGFSIMILFSACHYNEKKDTISANNTDSVESPVDIINPIDTTFELMEHETIGPLRLGLKEEKLINTIGLPDEKSEATFWDADALFHQDFTYLIKGIQINMCASDSIGEKEIFSITVQSPSTYGTSKGIKIGSSYQEVYSAYKPYIDESFSDSSALVAGSIYGGVIFSFEKEKVTSIFIGAAAE